MTDFIKKPGMQELKRCFQGHTDGLEERIEWAMPKIREAAKKGHEPARETANLLFQRYGEATARLYINTLIEINNAMIDGINQHPSATLTADRFYEMATQQWNNAMRADLYRLVQPKQDEVPQGQIAKFLQREGQPDISPETKNTLAESFQLTLSSYWNQACEADRGASRGGGMGR